MMLAVILIGFFCMLAWNPELIALASCMELEPQRKTFLVILRKMCTRLVARDFSGMTAVFLKANVCRNREPWT